MSTSPALLSLRRFGLPPSSRAQLLCKRGAALAAILLSAFLIWRLFVLVNQVAVDVPFWDQWDFYSSVFSGHTSLWTLFTQRHGPHRQGAGFLIIRLVDLLTDWNQRDQSFVIAATLVAAAGAALLLKYRLFGKLAWYDVAIPLLFFTRRQAELYGVTPNISHGVLPLLLLLLIALAWTLRPPALRYPLIAFLTFLATFTGFGLFAGIVVPLTLLLRAAEILRTKSARHPRELPWLLACLALCALTIALFLRGYVPDPATPDFVFPHPQPSLYGHFAAISIASSVGARSTSTHWILYGYLWLAFLITIVGLSFWRALTDRTAPPMRAIILFFLSTFTLIFIANCAIGRVPLGLGAAQAVRYMPLLIPGLLAIYFSLLAIPRPAIRWAMLLPFLLVLTIACTRSDAKYVRWLAQTKRTWVVTYQLTHSIEQADRAAGYPLHPSPTATHLQAKLDYLEERRLSFFRRPTTPAPESK